MSRSRLGLAAFVIAFAVSDIAFCTLVPDPTFGQASKGSTGGYEWGLAYANATHPAPWTGAPPPPPNNQRDSMIHYSAWFSEIQYDNAFPRHHPYCPPIELFLEVTITRPNPPGAPIALGGSTSTLPMTRTGLGRSKGSGTFLQPTVFVGGVSSKFKDGDMVRVFLLIKDKCSTFLSDTALFVWKD